MPMTRGRLGFVALGLAVVAAGTIGELERLSLMSSGLFPPWGPAAAAGTVGKLERLSPAPALFFASSPSAAHSLQAWALQRSALGRAHLSNLNNRITCGCCRRYSCCWSSGRRCR
jgi:hypothetical protein